MKQYRPLINALRNLIDDAQCEVESIHATTSFDGDMVDSMDDVVHNLTQALRDAISLRDAMAEQVETYNEEA